RVPFGSRRTGPRRQAAVTGSEPVSGGPGQDGLGERRASRPQRPALARAAAEGLDPEPASLADVLDLERRVLEAELALEDALELAAALVAVVAATDEHMSRERGEP